SGAQIPERANASATAPIASVRRGWLSSNWAVASWSRSASDCGSWCSRSTCSRTSAISRSSRSRSEEESEALAASSERSCSRLSDTGLRVGIGESRKYQRVRLGETELLRLDEVRGPSEATHPRAKWLAPECDRLTRDLPDRASRERSHRAARS